MHQKYIYKRYWSDTFYVTIHYIVTISKNSKCLLKIDEKNSVSKFSLEKRMGFNQINSLLTIIASIIKIVAVIIDKCKWQQITLSP